MKNILFRNGNCEEEFTKIESETINITFGDFPYLYLNQEWDKAFDEEKVISEITRTSKKDAYVILFGRGIAFCRWQLLLDKYGWRFLESMPWDKTQSTSPLSKISRVHEDCVIFGRGKAQIHKRKVPYLVQKRRDINGVCKDIDRLMTALNNPKSLKAVRDFLENNERDKSDSWGANNTTIGSEITKEDKCVSVVRSIKDGMREKSIIRTDYGSSGSNCKGITRQKTTETGDRCANVMQQIHVGMNEKSIIREGGTIIEVTRDHYNTIHGTQKPVELITRLFNVCGIMPDMNIIDPFAGSAASAIAALKMDCNWTGFELDAEHFRLASDRLNNEIRKRSEMLF